MRERYNYIHNNYSILANGGTLEDIKRKFAEGGETGLGTIPAVQMANKYKDKGGEEYSSLIDYIMANMPVEGGKLPEVTYTINDKDKNTLLKFRKMFPTK